MVAELQRAVDSVNTLPQDLRVQPSFLEIKSEEFPVIELAITGGDSERDRFDIAEHLKELLEDNRKISGIAIDGFVKKQFAIEVDPKLLIKNKVSLDQVTNAVMARNRNIPGGFIETSSTQNLIKLEAKVQSLEELEELVVRSNFSGQAIKLKDIAKIRESSEDHSFTASVNGEDAVLMIITKKSGTDLVELAEEIYPLLDELQKSNNNKFEFSIFNDEGKRVKNKVKVLSSNALWGLVLVVFFLIYFSQVELG